MARNDQSREIWGLVVSAWANYANSRGSNLNIPKYKRKIIRHGKHKPSVHGKLIEVHRISYDVDVFGQRQKQLRQLLLLLRPVPRLPLLVRPVLLVVSPLFPRQLLLLSPLLLWGMLWL